MHGSAPLCGLERSLVFDRFVARHAILKDNLTLLGYDLVFRSFQPRAMQQSTPPAAYAIDAATMVFPWES